MLLIIYKSLVRPHLEYARTVWTTTNTKEKLAIENVQPSIKQLSYQERLQKIGISTLQHRRLRTDMVETFAT